MGKFLFTALLVFSMISSLAYFYDHDFGYKELDMTDRTDPYLLTAYANGYDEQYFHANSDETLATNLGRAIFFDAPIHKTYPNASTMVVTVKIANRDDDSVGPSMYRVTANHLSDGWTITRFERRTSCVRYPDPFAEFISSFVYPLWTNDVCV